MFKSFSPDINIEMKTVRDTPRKVIDILIKKAEIFQGSFVLEPSAGNGAILEVLAEHKHHESMKVDAVELNDEKFRHINGKLKNDLLKKEFLMYNAVHMDFLQYTANQTISPYDRIVAAPPFKDNIDVLHIKAMYKLLAPEGIMVSLTTPYWLTNNETHQVNFRKWLEDKQYSITMLPDMTFVEKGKTVPTAIIKIYK